MIRITDAERRRRLVLRHHLGRTAADPETAVRGVAAMHSSDPATPYLACWARVPAFTAEGLDVALYERRSLRRMHAMRRTLFVVPTEDEPSFRAGAARDVARRERKRLEGWLTGEGQRDALPRWLAGVEARTLEALEGAGERTTGELAADVPELRTELTVGSGRWTTRVPLSSRLLFLLAMDGRIVRARPVGSWRSSQYRWRLAPRDADPPDEAMARAAILRRYLAGHGPATLIDMRWWTGWTVARTADALRRIGAVPVGLESGSEGFVLAEDAAGTPGHPEGPGPLCLLPALDPTPMGWKERGWYLGAHASALFDRSGNVGPTVWVDGRIVGGWGQRQDGNVVFRLLAEIGGAEKDALAREADALARWLAGVLVTPRFRTPLEKALRNA